MDQPLTTAGELGRLVNPGLLGDLPSPAPAASFWTWGSIILTAVASALAAAAFGILFSKLIQISIRFRRRRTLVRLPSFRSSGEEEDDDASISSCDTSTGDGDETDEMEDKDEEEEEEDEERWRDFRGAEVNGAGNISFSSFSLADLVEGMGVVKAWDGMGLGRFDGSVGAPSFFDMSLGEILNISTSGSTAQITGPTTQLAWPEETTNHRRGAVVRFWDGRAGDEAPAATTRPLFGQRVGAGVMAREGGELIRRR
ncbi:hypothetical protein KSP39_PZI004931 [Platanthera zijinensis]|uniref:Uncharacterized protein n=1 Tax=Platanthera zijinensis TaxID=2320716 RepID=A0AAP0GCR5_9ASPA